MNLVATLQCKGGDNSRDIEMMWNPKSELSKITRGSCWLPVRCLQLKVTCEFDSGIFLDGQNFLGWSKTLWSGLRCQVACNIWKLMFLNEPVSKMRRHRGFQPENLCYANYSMYLSRGVWICRFGTSVQNSFFSFHCCFSFFGKEDFSRITCGVWMNMVLRT